MCEDLQAVQHAPHRDLEPWRAGSGGEWLAGTAQAARALLGRGSRWSQDPDYVLFEEPVPESLWQAAVELAREAADLAAA